MTEEPEHGAGLDLVDESNEDWKVCPGNDGVHDVTRNGIYSPCESVECRECGFEMILVPVATLHRLRSDLTGDG